MALAHVRLLCIKSLILQPESGKHRTRNPDGHPLSDKRLFAKGKQQVGFPLNGNRRFERLLSGERLRSRLRYQVQSTHYYIWQKSRIHKRHRYGHRPTHEEGAGCPKRRMSCIPIITDSGWMNGRIRSLKSFSASPAQKQKRNSFWRPFLEILSGWSRWINLQWTITLH